MAFIISIEVLLMWCLHSVICKNLKFDMYAVGIPVSLGLLCATWSLMPLS